MLWEPQAIYGVLESLARRHRVGQSGFYKFEQIVAHSPPAPIEINREVGSRLALEPESAVTPFRGIRRLASERRRSIRHSSEPYRQHRDAKSPIAGQPW